MTKRKTSKPAGRAARLSSAVINRTQRQRSEAAAVARNCGSNGCIITIMFNDYSKNNAVLVL